MLEAVHFSNLKKFALSAAHYRAACDEPNPMTPSMRFGSLVHHVYAGETIVVFDGDRRGNKWKKFAEEHEGEEIFTKAELDKAQRCADSIRKTPRAVEVLHGEVERTIEWWYMKRRCSSRLDVLAPDYVTDLKTTNCAEPSRFRRAALGRFAYHAQLAFYLQAAARVEARPREAYIVAVETVGPPYAVTVHRLTRRCLQDGEKLCRLWFEQLLVCEASGEWPSYCQAVLDMDSDDDVNLVIDGEEIAA